jgi:alginate O-acetyltransferase complex protein AlgI
MLFNSFICVVFAALFFLGWPLAARRQSSRWAYLTGAALLFYGWHDWRYIFLLLAVSLGAFSCGVALARWPGRQRLTLTLGVVFILGLLGVFKYLGFAMESLNAMLAWLGAGGTLPVVKLALPMGLSFYTFLALSYVLDVRRGAVKPAANFLHLTAYLSLWPALLAGPITRARDLLPQLLDWQPPDSAQRFRGMQLIAHGLFKKAVLADQLAPIVNQAFGAATPEASALYWWVIVAMYTVQIYCDFAGYSDIAIGLGYWLGLKLADNFDHPYTARGIGDFWNRWHMSLTGFLRTYLFLPLANRWAYTLRPRGGDKRKANRIGASRAAYLATLVTFTLCGLWHGAAWTFVAWGALHSIYLVFERATRWHTRLLKLPLGSSLATLLTLLQVALAWVVFRAGSLGQAWTVLTRLSSFGELNPGPALGLSKLALLVLALAIAREAWVYFRLERYLPAPVLRARLEPLWLALILAASVFLRGPGGAFIYAQF